jgi:hypothetical protein
MSDYQQRERAPGTGVLLTNRFKKGSRPRLARRTETRPILTLLVRRLNSLPGPKKRQGGALISLKEDNYVKPETGNDNPFPSKRRDDDNEVPF